MKEFCMELECELKDKVKNLEMFKCYTISVSHLVCDESVVVILLNDINIDEQGFCEIADWRSSFKLFGKTHRVRIVVKQGKDVLFKDIRDLLRNTEVISDKIIWNLKWKREEGEINDETN